MSILTHEQMEKRLMALENVVMLLTAESRARSGLTEAQIFGAWMERIDEIDCAVEATVKEHAALWDEDQGE